jgi:GTP:adenosylcobinamide-phosphate guanylyltransferase
MMPAALVLAGSRGEVDPVALYAGVGHKALVTVGGRPMVLRVIDALRQAGFERIVVSTDAPEVVDLARGAGAVPVTAESKLSQSVAAALDDIGPPLLVTTADHALLEAGWIAELLDKTPSDADLSLLMAERRVIEAAAPATRRTYYRFSDGAWSGCNLFLLQRPQARHALDLWTRVEAYRKQPWRLAALIGAGTLLRYAIGGLAVGDAVGRIGRSVGLRAVVVPSVHGLSAIDVDKPADLDFVRGLLGG